MDPITLIVTALAAGARATHRDGAPPALPDPRAAEALPDPRAELVTLARQRLSGRPNGGMVLRQHAEDPARWSRALAKALAAEGADGDAGLVTAAQAVLRLTDEAGSSRGKYVLDAARPSGQAPA